jgi:hypothetical protein
MRGYSGRECRRNGAVERGGRQRVLRTAKEYRVESAEEAGEEICFETKREIIPPQMKGQREPQEPSASEFPSVFSSLPR